MSINCSKCGTELEDDSKFCTECGEKVVKPEELDKEIDGIIEGEGETVSPPKMKKGTKGILIVLTIITCISLVLMSAALVDIDIVGTVFENKPPTVSISADSTFSYCSSGVSFEIDADDSDGLVQSCYVDFGDGTISQGYNFVHEYKKAGVYTVIVTVTDDKGNEASCNITITIEESLTVSADADVTSGTFPLTIFFTGHGKDALGNLTGYYWDFGDGNTSNEQNPTHVFEKPGTYAVTLIVSNDRGENASDKITISVKHKTSFKLSGKIINNYNEKVDIDYAVLWNFGDWNYWAPTKTLSPYEEKDFSCSVKPYDKEYLLMAQWFYPGTSQQGCEISQILFSNPTEKDMIYYIEIKGNGEIEISTTYHPSNPPKTPEIISHNAYSTSYYTYVFGKIKNVDNLNIKYVNIEITLYDSSNNIISTKTEYPFVSLIGSQQTSSFSTYFYEDYYHHYDIKIKSFETTNENPYTGLVITNHYQETDWLGWYYIKGEIENIGNKASNSVKVNAIFYGSNGDILTTEYDWIGDLYSGEKESFEITLYSSDLSKLPSSISSYELEIG